MEFAKCIEPMYRGPTVNWVDVDSTKIYAQPKFSDKCLASDYSQKYGFDNDADFNYVKEELKKIGCKLKEVINTKIS